ncbi:MAG: glycerate kinase [Candidatus Paceibacteria bacterium]
MLDVIVIIKNFKKLAITPLRKSGLTIISSGLDAIKTEKVISENIKIKDAILKIQDKSFNLRQFRRIFFVGIGKAALSGAKAIEKVLGKYLVDGISLDVNKGKLRKIQSISGTHPFPSERNIKATQKIIKILKEAGKNDLVIALISGGGSALLCSLTKATCDEEVLLTQLLFKKGANIKEINTVRKHISDIKGGNFAKLAYPATVIGLIFSDVPGCAPSVVASGPTYQDTTTVEDAKKVIKKYHLPRLELFETPKERKYFRRVYNFLLVCNDDAQDAMSKKAKELGFKTKKVSSSIEGEARRVGKLLAKLAKPGWAIIAGGETTVKVKHKGRGGRNQELVLGALGVLPKGALIISINSDGFDNTPVAGALGDDIILERARKLRMDPEKYLRENASYKFFERVGGHIITGPTGINVSDLMLILMGKKWLKDL